MRIQWIQKQIRIWREKEKSLDCYMQNNSFKHVKMPQMQVIQRNRRLTFETYFEIKSIKTIGSLALKVIFISSISVHRRYPLK